MTGTFHVFEGLFCCIVGAGTNWSPCVSWDSRFITRSVNSIYWQFQISVRKIIHTADTALCIKAVQFYSHCWLRHMQCNNTENSLLSFRGKAFSIYCIVESDMYVNNTEGRTFAFPFHRWLNERERILRNSHISCLVTNSKSDKEIYNLFSAYFANWLNDFWSSVCILALY